MRRGAATFSTDHVVKKVTARSGFAIGGQHKKAGLNGVLFELINLEPFGAGLLGKSRLVIHKDRNGGLRQHGVPDPEKPRISHFADLYLDALQLEGSEKLTLDLRPPSTASRGDRDRIQEVADAIVRFLKSDESDGSYDSEAKLRSGIRESQGATFRNEEFLDALTRLFHQQVLEEKPGRTKQSKAGRLKDANRSQTAGNGS